MTKEATGEKQASRSPQEITHEVQSYLEHDLPDAARAVAFNDFLALFDRRMTLEATRWRLDEINEKNFFLRRTGNNRKWAQAFSNDLRLEELKFTQLDTAIRLERNRWPAYDEAYRSIKNSFEQLVSALNGRGFHFRTSSRFSVVDVYGLVDGKNSFKELQISLRQRNNPQKPLR